MNPWEKILERLEERVPPQSFARWLKPSSFSHVEDTALFVRVPNEIFRDWYRKNLSSPLEEALQALSLGMDRVEFLCTSEESAKQPATQAAFDFESSAGQFNPSYTFGTFVVGACNQFAHAAAQAVAQTPAKAYNPLFLYGGVGLGKTHLTQAIGNALRATPRQRLCYVSGEQFLNDMINSLRYDRMVSFHDRYRNLDALLVDDIQFLGNKERTQEEFFHTFNALYAAQKQIVITSDRPPAEIPQLEDRLRSRFEWGLIADFQPPDLETKIAILMRKAESRGVALPDDVALYIAGGIRTNIRELEGSLNRLIAYASMAGAEMNLALAQQILKDALAAQERKVSIEAVQNAVAREFSVKGADLKVRNNSRKIVRPRQIAMYLCREMSGSSLPEIGHAFGGKHHTTVLHSVEKIRKEKKEDKDLNRLIHKLMDSLR